jgi:hypothetical protein
MYFSRRPDQATRVRADGQYSIKIRNALEGHDNPADGAEMVRLYSVLSQATHPSALSMNLHVEEGQPRIQEYSFDTARDSFIYLIALAQHVLGVVRDLVVAAGVGEDWLPIFEQLERDAEAWNAAQHR